MASLSFIFFWSRSPFSFFIFFLYFYMHACNSNARSTRATHPGSLKEFLDCKIGEKIKLTMDNSFRQGANTIQRQSYSPPSRRIPVQIFGSKAKEEVEDARTKSGRKVVESSSRMINFLKATKREVSGGPAAEQDAKVEATRSQNNIAQEDIIKTDDYHSPHRNSPIHNK